LKAIFETVTGEAVPIFKDGGVGTAGRRAGD